MNVLRKGMAAEVEALKPVLDEAYAAILGFQRDRSRSNEATLRAALEPAVEQIMIFRPLLPAYKQYDFEVLETRWRTLNAHDLIMLFDHCISIMHVRLERNRSANEALQPWSSELLRLLDRRRETPTATPVEGQFLCSGIAASGGRARGTARVTYSADDLEAVQPGDVVVCRFTRPGLVAYFSGISALVTDEGGALSHAAIIARERGLPCVTGCKDATVKIATGTSVEVDGDLGLVMAVQTGPDR